jgi:DNA/RNA-binding protein KIN17
MGKHDFFSPKAVANRQKSKGLQKLRWFCQMCEKQCRDENGFKYAPRFSAATHAQMPHSVREPSATNDGVFGRFWAYRGLVFVSIQEWIFKDFIIAVRTFKISLIMNRYGTRRVLANTVYQEYIGDKDHVHMNGTRWATLSGFIQYLGREGLCRVEEAERGWFITWIDNSPQSLARQDAIQKMDRLKKDQAERDRTLIDEQIERGKAALTADEPVRLFNLECDNYERFIRSWCGMKRTRSNWSSSRLRAPSRRRPKCLRSHSTDWPPHRHRRDPTRLPSEKGNES